MVAQATTEDNLVEGDENFNVTLGSTVNVTNGLVPTTIVDDDTMAITLTSR